MGAWTWKTKPTNRMAQDPGKAFGNPHKGFGLNPNFQYPSLWGGKWALGPGLGEFWMEWCHLLPLSRNRQIQIPPPPHTHPTPPIFKNPDYSCHVLFCCFWVLFIGCFFFFFFFFCVVPRVGKIERGCARHSKVIYPCRLTMYMYLGEL